MSSLDKFLALTISFLLLSSLIILTVCPITIQAVPKPSVPQFSVELTNHPYDVPPTTSTHPYTGETTTTPGYHADNCTINVSMKNQPFKTYTDADGTEFNLYYRAEYKGHFEDNWQEWGTKIVQSTSGYTVVSHSKNYPAGYQLDFRVLAIIGYFYNAMPDRPIIPQYAFGWAETSAYSNIQTFTMPDIYSPNTSPSQTTTLSESPTTFFDGNQTSPQDQPKISEVILQPIFLLSVEILFIGIVVAIVMVFLRRHLKTFEFNKDAPQNNDDPTNYVT
ncbi:MAG: hypothetical protein LBC03_07460 [Nitrososphaerota archaeon]|jgi:hypothetical protein|nr:hypothetical protein [Nitrososphaerota archaeon]